MKKILLLITCVFLITTGCQTQEEREQEKEKQRIDNITEEVKKNTEIPEEAKTWMIDNKSKKVLTILCIKTSNRCLKLKEDIKDLDKNVKVYYIELDDLEDDVKNIYKETYNLDNYTGYLPYVYLVDNNKLISKNANVKNIDDLKEMITNEKTSK